MMTKKAQIGTTITWMVAFIIIFFIMALFIILSGALSAKKFSLLERNKISIKDEVKRASIEQDFEFFLNSLVEFNGEEIPIRHLIVEDLYLKPEKFEKFKGLCSEFLESGKFSGNIWIRIYDSSDVALKTSLIAGKENKLRENKYEKYSSYKRGVFQSNCNPLGSGVFYSEFLIPENKKIGVCFDYK